MSVKYSASLLIAVLTVLCGKFGENVYFKPKKSVVLANQIVMLDMVTSHDAGEIEGIKGGS